MIISWNVRGLNKSGKTREISSRLLDLNPAIIVLIETRVKRNKTQTIRDKLKLRGSYLDNYGKHENSRIWVYWDENKVDIEHVCITDQLIHYKICDNTGNVLNWLTAIYAQNQLDMRRKLWQDIETIHYQQHGQWMLIGDFNNVLKVEDITEGTMVNEKEYIDLTSMMSATELYEMESTGDYFTWSNKQGENAIHYRIDKVLGNVEWMQKNVDIVLTNMTPSVTDHAMLVLKEQENT
ncbi:unnamed protein product [Lathyrus sativus]|nr:unnamed protein product [Lathyrus sativus]